MKFRFSIIIILLITNFAYSLGLPSQIDKIKQEQEQEQEQRNKLRQGVLRFKLQERNRLKLKAFEDKLYEEYHLKGANLTSAKVLRTKIDHYKKISNDQAQYNFRMVNPIYNNFISEIAEIDGLQTVLISEQAGALREYAAIKEVEFLERRMADMFPLDEELEYDYFDYDVFRLFKLNPDFSDKIINQFVNLMNLLSKNNVLDIASPEFDLNKKYINFAV